MMDIHETTLTRPGGKKSDNPQWTYITMIGLTTPKEIIQYRRVHGHNASTTSTVSDIHSPTVQLYSTDVYRSSIH